MLYAEKPDDLDVIYARAVCLAAEGKYEEALEELLRVVRRDKHYRGGAAKEAMVRIFSVVGKRSALADEYRSKLTQLLY